MNDAHRRIGRLHALAAVSGRKISIDTDIFGVDLQIFIVGNFRQHFNERKRGVAHLFGVKRRNAHQTMNTMLAFHVAVGVWPLDRDGHRFYPGHIPFLKVQLLDLVIVAFAPADIHPHQHLRPILAFRAAGAGIDLDIGVVAVRLAGKQRFKFGLLCARAQLFDGGARFIQHRLITLAVSHFGEFDIVRKVALQRAHRVYA